MRFDRQGQSNVYVTSERRGFEARVVRIGAALAISSHFCVAMAVAFRVELLKLVRSQRPAIDEPLVRMATLRSRKLRRASVSTPSAITSSPGPKAIALTVCATTASPRLSGEFRTNDRSILS